MIRQAYLSDIDVINQLIDKFGSKKISDYELINDPFTRYVVYYQDNTIMGFISYAIMYERSEINYLLVEVNYRKQGIASKLMDYMINDCIKNKCVNITLEVNESNDNAILLYKKFEFEKIAVRKNYYGSNNGIVMERILVNK